VSLTQNDPATVVISIPLSVQPQSAVLQGTGVDGGLVMSPVTSVSKTHPPASDELLLEEALDELLLEEALLEEASDEASDELLPLPLSLEEAEEPPAESTRPPSPGEPGLLLLLLPHPFATTPAMAAAITRVERAKAIRAEDLMCRSHSRPGWAS